MNPTLTQILNFKQLSPQLATGGQPNAEELLALCRAGFEVVINLGLHDAPYALPDEARVLAAHGVEYHHLPVDFQSPQVARYFAFQDLLRGLSQRKCFIHCAANKRVSTFMALFRILELGWSRSEAEREMHQIWQPDAAWQAFMQQVLSDSV
jgi:protein tyrosine phosphatase (PTP) superfamily phosphohydrolase (DUF442 family)